MTPFLMGILDCMQLNELQTACRCSLAIKVDLTYPVKGWCKVVGSRFKLLCLKSINYVCKCYYVHLMWRAVGIKTPPVSFILAVIVKGREMFGFESLN